MNMNVYTPRSFHRMLKYLIEEGDVVEVNGQRTYEVVGMAFRVRNPLDRVVPHKRRKMNIAFAMAEWLSYFAGEDRVEYFEPFMKKYANWSSDGVTIDGAYGPRLYDPEDQIETIVDKLSADANSRRAVATIYDSEDLFGRGGVNTPCTLTWQFLVRDEAVHMIANMRSNDLVWGLTYDLFSFTMMQEYVASRLGMNLGQYYHNAGSMHVYERHWSMLDELQPTTRWPNVMRPMPRYTTRDDVMAVYDIFANINDQTELSLLKLDMPQYWLNWVWVAYIYTHRKEDKAMRLASKVRDVTLRRIIKMWVRDA